MLSRLRATSTLALPNVWHSVCPAWRALSTSSSSGGGTGKGDDGDDDMSKHAPPTSSSPSTSGEGDGDADDDGFGMDDFLSVDAGADAAAADELQSKLDELERMETQGEDAVTPELTSDLVNRMVSRLSQDDQLSRVDILPSISPHTIDVLRAARICTNWLCASGSGHSEKLYPIKRRVVGHLDIPMLGLSPPAELALRMIAGPQRLEMACSIKEEKEMEMEMRTGTGLEERRLKEKVKVSCDKFPTMIENRTYVVSRMHALVKQAKLAVGEAVDERALGTWEDVVKQVEEQAAEEVQEAGDVHKLLGQTQ